MRSLFLALAIIAGAQPIDVASAGQREVEERLACQCGCGLTVHTCNHLQCSFAIPVRDEITKRLAAGDSEDAIIADYVAEYGEKVLSAPTREGFNLLAWWGPYAVLTAGVFALLAALRRMRRASAQQPAPDAGATEDAITPDARAALERELRELDS